jgi:formyltetrahydrofolate-dependent phosphoribosylglycinamide formyltransferase
MKKRVAAFCSHGGSNFAAIADAAAAGDFPADVTLMIHNNAKAGAKAKAEQRGIATAWVPRKSFATDADYARRLAELLARHDIQIIALAGFMQLIPAEIVQQYEGRITNIHPALLPFFGGRGFYGMNVHRAVFDSGMQVSGPTVHLVDEKYDQGIILKQLPVDISACTDAEAIAAEVLKAEHKLYPEVIGLLAEDRFKFAGRRAILR